ncbi:murein transglycosylase A [Synechocystis sp. LKSZ1]|uniref:murein transglycosylase A n=1 Tax=Synechocystis sp. LKSZ1 TaxID=3144951 RepID=UPI00336C1176
MKLLLTLPALALGLSLALPLALVAQNRVAVLVPLPPASIPEGLGRDEQLFAQDRQALLQAINHSLTYLNSPKAARDYHNYPIASVTQARVKRSLLRFQTLVKQARSAQSLQSAVQREFVFYQASGHDQQGTVHFTGYFEPIYTASRRRTEQYRYPIYRRPPDLAQWPKPHPPRSVLEGADGRGRQSPLKGQELLWFRDRLEAFLVQIQGSAKINLPDGRHISLAFDGATDYPYTSIGKEMVKDGIFQPGEITLPKLIDYLKANPAQLDRYLPRNQRLIFFRETAATVPAKGSLGVPVTAERSIATDKTLMPPGALALLQAPIPNRQLQKTSVSRYVLDQDTGSAIQGPGRVDIFMGTGTLAGDRAGLMSDDGKLYYLLLR